MTVSYAEDAANKAQAWNALCGKTAADIAAVYYAPQGNISARAGYTGQCTWYAYGRFNEVTGVPLKTALHAKFWLSMNEQDERLEVFYGENKICYPSVAVSTFGAYGHVMFIEYVSMKDGQPDTVYFTECNWDGNGRYDEGEDAVVLRLPFDLFVKYRMPDGYIAAKALDS
ncbi:MAG: CHAP domain-containing protein [Clostridia bacterium]|nr:CHAP domain-containing protein [Clostridia bacterium]